MLDKVIFLFDEIDALALDRTNSHDLREMGRATSTLLKGLDKRLHQKTKLPIHIAEDPLRAVVRGTGTALKNIQHFRTVLMT